MEHVKIVAADFESAMLLKSAVLKAASLSGIDINRLADMEISEALLAAVSVDVSPEVSAALWPCLQRCTYRGAKIVPDTFEKVEMRELYYPIAIECVKVNLTPFFKGLLSAFSGSGEIVKSLIQKQG